VATGSAAGRREIPQLRHVCEAVIYEHVFGNADREVGGVLVGKVAVPGMMPVITGAIPAIAADEQRATLTFTQDSWEHVHRVLDRDFAGHQIVGWYHSHPSFGIFLSGHDLFIHRNFFAGASQIAFVVDPIGQEEGVFAWRKSKEDVDLYFQQPTPAGWYARTKDGKTIPTRPSRVSEEDALHEPEDAEAFSYPLIILAAALAAGFIAAFVVAYVVLSPGHGPHSRHITTIPVAPAKSK
jgi:proteasome lid subunit RPN8/RPN11